MSLEKRVCIQCGKEKAIDAFHLCHPKKNDYHYKKCSDCRNYEQRERTRKTSVRDALRDWYIDIKSRLSCKYCPENHPACIQFHHRNPEEKCFSISKAVYFVSHTREEILEEMDKCDAICANCHFKLHDAERTAKTNG